MITSNNQKQQKLNNFLNRKPVQDWVKQVTGLDTLKIVLTKFLKAQETNESYNFFFEDVLYRVGLERELFYIITSKKGSKEAVVNPCPFKFE